MDQEKLELIVNTLNKNLKKRMNKKRREREKRLIKPQWGLYFSIAILLIILALIYMYLHRMLMN
jgi:cytoskeletal protein RodZ